MPPNPKVSSEMEVDRAGQPSGDGLRSYYITKIEELLLTVNDKRQNVRRLQVRLLGFGICDILLSLCLFS